MTQCTKTLKNSVAVFLQPGSHYNIRCYDTHLTVLLGECYINGYKLTPASTTLSVCSLDSQYRVSLTTGSIGSVSESEVHAAARFFAKGGGALAPPWFDEGGA